MYECRACNFDMCERCMKADVFIYKFWSEKPWKHSKYGHTFKRRSPIDDNIEFIAQAGDNESSHTKYATYYDK